MHSGFFPLRQSRRKWLWHTAHGAGCASLSGWLPALAADAAEHPQRKRACILLWMGGGASQIDTFDPKPKHENGGSFREIQTNVAGIRISEHLPRVANLTDRLAIIRSMATREGDHARATFTMRTGYRPQGAVQFPALGALVGKELRERENGLPPFVGITPYRAGSGEGFGAGFLGPQWAPLRVGEPSGQAGPDNELNVPNLAPPPGVTPGRLADRISLLGELERDFHERLTQRLGSEGGSKRAADPSSLQVAAHQAAYDRAARLMRSSASKVFDLSEEPLAVRESYGRNQFGQSCLLARRLVERGVPFVEVAMHRSPGADNGWDTHRQNFTAVKSLCGVLDAGWAALMHDLKQRGLLDSTLIVWMGEFGRTPKINLNAGRDHYPNAWSTVLAGGGIRGGQVVGATSHDGTDVEQRPVSAPDFISTICSALGIDPRKQNESNVGRPIRIADPSAEPIREVVV